MICLPPQCVNVEDLFISRKIMPFRLACHISSSAIRWQEISIVSESICHDRIASIFFCLNQ